MEGEDVTYSTSQTYGVKCLHLKGLVLYNALQYFTIVSPVFPLDGHVLGTEIFSTLLLTMARHMINLRWITMRGYPKGFVLRRCLFFYARCIPAYFLNHS